MKQMLNIALPKGRLGEKAYSVFEKIGLDCPEIRTQNRKLIFENENSGVRFFWVKPSDVGMYVERGAADIGVLGKDILLENSPDVYELLDLRAGKCKMVVAGKKGAAADTGRTLRVATSFPNITREYFGRQSRNVDIIKLSGSVEIAPLIGLSDVIVDIVETGSTLKENDLGILDVIFDISARLISNKVSYKFKHDEIEEVITEIGKLLGNGEL